MRFQLGRCVATPGALVELQRTGTSPSFLIAKHVTLDPGCLNKEDQAANEEAVRTGARVFSAYMVDAKTKVWVITDAADDDDVRESTCILLPSEY